MPVTEKQPAARTYRRGTNIRRRQALVGVRLTAEEYAELKAAAERERSSPGSVLREAFFQYEKAAT